MSDPVEIHRLAVTVWQYFGLVALAWCAVMVCIVAAGILQAGRR